MFQSVPSHVLHDTALIILGTVAGLIAAKFAMDALLKMVHRKNIESLDMERYQESKAKTMEVREYAMSVNASLSCLDQQLKEAASSQNVHICEL